MVAEIRKILEKAVGKEAGQVFISERPEFGNYSTNAAFLLEKDLKKPPLEIAKELVAKIEKEERGKKKEERLFSKVEAAAPGFVNFWLSPAALQKELVNVLRNTCLPAGRRKTYEYTKKAKINIEFISANPTGPLTMANGRGGFLGDVIANVLENVGTKVTREYYINDAGNQIRLLGESILAVLGKIPVKPEYYQGDYIRKLAPKFFRLVNIQYFTLLNGKHNELDVQKIEKLGRLAAAELLKQIKKSVKNAGIKFDVWFSEYEELRSSSRTNAEKTRTDAEAIQKGSKIQNVLELLEKKGLIEKKEGAVWLKTSDIADEKDRVLVKSNGEPTYFLADIAYHYDKFIKRKFDKAIVIWGADHHGYVARLKSGLKAIGIAPEKLRIIITQLVRLVKKGEEARMSKRKGEFVTLDDLIREVGADAARFFFLMQSPDTHMDFDLELAKERSMKNPVYYAQYAYVRCLSILRKSKIQSSKSKTISNAKFQNLNSESELNLIRELIKLPYMIQQTAEDYQVNRLTRYVGEIARAFHNFYEKERVIGEPKEIMEARLVLVSATQNVLGRVFDILGIDKPKKM